MADKKEKNAKKNSVHLTGFLKENLLEKITDKDGKEVIRGSMTIATSSIDSHKVTFYASRFDKDGNETEAYKNLEEMLPEKTISVASYLKNTPTAIFDTAANGSTKLWAQARFEEYAKRKGEREDSSVFLRGFKAGFKTASDKSPFVPRAEFSVDVYLNDIKEEVVEEKETGRLLIEGIIVSYNGMAHKIDFVAPAEDGIADYIRANYKVGDTVTLNGDVLNIYEKRAVEDDKEEEAFFGRSAGKQYETVFVRERRIRGGSKTPIHQGEEGSYSTKEVKKALVNREAKMVENGKKSKDNKGEGQTSPAAPEQPKKNTGFSDNFSDVDF